MKAALFLLLVSSFFIMNCGGSSHGTYMHNRTRDQQIEDEQRDKVIEEEQSKAKIQGSVDQKMEEFNRKALEKQPASNEEEQ